MMHKNIHIISTGTPVAPGICCGYNVIEIVYNTVSAILPETKNEFIADIAETYQNIR
jgi:hypothetical protein